MWRPAYEVISHENDLKFLKRYLGSFSKINVSAKKVFTFYSLDAVFT